MTNPMTAGYKTLKIRSYNSYGWGMSLSINGAGVAFGNNDYTITNDSTIKITASGTSYQSGSYGDYKGVSCTVYLTP